MKNKINFINYMTKPLSEESINILYSTNNVKYDRVNLYLDFVLSLLHIIFDTYLGNDLTINEERIKHFDWCWDRNINNFKKEFIFFENEDELKIYYKEFMLEIYYNQEKNESNLNIQNNIINLWINIFNYKGIKTNNDMDSFIEIYNIFDKSLKN